MKKIIKLMVDNMSLLVVLAGVTGALYPELLTWASPYVSYLLGLVMFGMGMTLRVTDFRKVLEKPRQVMIGTGKSL